MNPVANYAIKSIQKLDRENAELHKRLAERKRSEAVEVVAQIKDVPGKGTFVKFLDIRGDNLTADRTNGRVHGHPDYTYHTVKHYTPTIAELQRFYKCGKIGGETVEIEIVRVDVEEKEKPAREVKLEYQKLRNSSYIARVRDAKTNDWLFSSPQTPDYGKCLDLARQSLHEIGSFRVVGSATEVLGVVGRPDPRDQKIKDQAETLERAVQDYNKLLEENGRLRRELAVPRASGLTNYERARLESQVAMLTRSRDYYRQCVDANARQVVTRLTPAEAQSIARDGLVRELQYAVDEAQKQLREARALHDVHVNTLRGQIEQQTEPAVEVPEVPETSVYDDLSGRKWYTCTREFAKQHPKHSQVTWGMKNYWCRITGPEVSTRVGRVDAEFRTVLDPITEKKPLFINKGYASSTINVSAGYMPESTIEFVLKDGRTFTGKGQFVTPR